MHFDSARDVRSVVHDRNRNNSGSLCMIQNQNMTIFSHIYLLESQVKVQYFYLVKANNKL